MLQVPAILPLDAFQSWWQRQGDWVEEPNVRRGGESGVQRLYDEGGGVCYAKRQNGHVHRTLRHPFGLPTALREAYALRAWQALGVRVPRILYCGAQRVAGAWQALLVTEAMEGFVDIEHWYADGGREACGEALHALFMQRLGATLATLHQARWQHGCLYAKHVFVRVHGQGETAEVEVALLDLEKSRRRLTKKQAARHDLRQLRRHSSWSDADWQQLLYGYQSALTSTIKRQRK